MSIRTHARRAAAFLAGGALVASGLGLAGPAPVAHAADTPAPEATATATWLDGQLVDGLLSGDVSRTMDFGLSLLASGTDSPELLAKINAGIDAKVDAYISGAFSPNASNAKAAYYYQVTGLDATDFLTELAADVDDTTGQIDGGTVYSQVWAVLALQQAGSAETPKALNALLATQCTTGDDVGSWGYSCTGGADYDYTAYSILALLPFDEDANAIAAVDKAVAWLKSETAEDGGIGETMWTPNNTNSTGLVAWALGETGDPAAAKSAAWVARHQLLKLTGCPADPEPGAIGYDTTALANARADGEIATPDRSQWTLASAQALAGLAYLSTPAVGKISAPTGYVRAWTNVTVKVSGLRTGQPGCLAGFGNAERVGGPVSTTVGLPPTTGNRILALRWINGSTTATIKALGAKTFSPRVTSARVRRGGTQTILVTGLAPGERFSVRYAGRVVRTGTATSAGGVRASFRVGQTTGVKGVVVLGQFSNRRGSTTFRVVR